MLQKLYMIINKWMMQFSNYITDCVNVQCNACLEISIFLFKSILIGWILGDNILNWYHAIDCGCGQFKSTFIKFMQFELWPYLYWIYSWELFGLTKLVLNFNENESYNFFKKNETYDSVALHFMRKLL